MAPGFSTIDLSRIKRPKNMGSALEMDQVAAQVALRSALSEIGLYPGELICDGQLHRVSHKAEGTKNKAGWYVANDHDYGLFGAYGNWAIDDEVRKFSSRNERELSPQEAIALGKVRAEQKAAYDKACAERIEAGKTKAAADLVDSLPADPEFAYLVRKQLKLAPSSLLRMQADGAYLIVPAYNVTGEIQTYQRIYPDGSKRFMAGGSPKEAFFGIAGDQTKVMICEGFATAQTVSEAMGYLTICAFSAGNVPQVANLMRQEFPVAELVVCADNDHEKPLNAGLAAARKAAKEAGAKVCYPASEPGITDFNDLALAHGLDAVSMRFKELFTNIKEHSTVQTSPQELVILSASDIKPEPIEWLWDGWLAAGKLHIFGGAPGTGKTTLSLALAATISEGGYWPDRTKTAPGDVVIWSGEDDPADTLIPRLVLAGADLNHIKFIGDVVNGGNHRSFDPAKDIGLLKEKMHGIGEVRLLIVDPIVSAITGDSHKNAEVRRDLQPLVDLAAEFRCAIIGITHFSKGTGGRDPVERITGSLAFGALARIVWVAAKNYSDVGSEGLFLRAKSNIGPDDGGFAYSLEERTVPGYPAVVSTHVEWVRRVEGRARELLTTAEAPNSTGETSALDNAQAFLRDLLAGGAVPTNTVEEKAAVAGISWASVLRAKKNLGISSKKIGGNYGASNQKWCWVLVSSTSEVPEQAGPEGEESEEAEDAQSGDSQKLSTFSNNEHLDEIEVII